MRDFTKIIYEELLNELRMAGYLFVGFEEYLNKIEEKKKTVILRHDVDKSPRKALEMAEMEKMLGIRGTYYFRIKKDVFPEDEIKRIAAMGHEIGYHYEDLDVARGDVGAALASFKRNLERLREIVPVRTICMHGSPMSRFDNRKMWQDHDYRRYGIIGEPYFDIDFSKILYLTDTGRRWDGWRVSIRDKVGGQRSEVRGEGLGVRGERLGVRGEREEVRGEKTEVRSQKAEDREEAEDCKQKKDYKRNGINRQPGLHSTHEIICALRNNQLPEQIMLTIHPQRWSDEWGPWLWELVSQNVKNGVKYFIAKRVVSSE